LTTEQFIHEAQGYFGPYSPIQKKYVSLWLREIPAKALPLLWAEILKAVSPVYKVPPGIKELDDAWRVVKERRWDELLPAPEYQDDGIPTDADKEKVAEQCRELLGNLADCKTAGQQGGSWLK